MIYEENINNNDEYNKINISKSFKDLNNIYKCKFNYKIFSFCLILMNILLIIIICNITLIKKRIFKSLKNANKDKKKVNKKNIYDYTRGYKYFTLESNLPQLSEISKKMSFEPKLPLPESIHCKPHLNNRELMALLSLLSNDTIFFETGSGCSTIIAKFFAKKTYAIEGCKKFYEYGIENGLKNNIIFKDLKPDNPTWSYPGKKSNLKDWKNYFQSYKKEYNADVILIDGRFKVATAMDIFNKIRNDTIVLLHEYNIRPSYYIIEKYYKYIYHWGSLFLFIKRCEIDEIPLDIQKKYWDQSL